MPATVPPSRRMDATRPELIDHILDAQAANDTQQLLDRYDLAGLHTVFAAVPTDRLFSARTVHKLARARTSRLLAIHADWRTKHDGTGA